MMTALIMQSTISSVCSAMRSTVTTATSVIKNTIANTWTAVNSNTTTSWNSIKNTITSALTAIRTAVTTAMTVIKNTIANTHTAIISNTTTSWTTIKTTISTALTEMKNKVTEVLAAIKKLFSDTFTEIANIVKNKMADANTNMTNALNTMKTNVSTACSAIKTSVSSYLSMGSDAYQWGRDICIQMAAGINAEAWRVRSAASNLASAVDNTLGFSVPEEGPLSHADEYMPDFMKLMAEGIEKNAKVVMSAVRGLSDSMSGVFTGLSIPEVNAGQLALAGAGGGTVSNSKTINMGGLTVNVNGYNVQNDDDLADKVADRINAMLNEDDSVWGR